MKTPASFNKVIVSALRGVAYCAFLAFLNVMAPLASGQTLQSIALTPANGSVPAGMTQQFAATGTYSDGSTQNLTGSVTWSSTVSATAKISSGGLATGLAPGTTTIQATLGSISASTNLTVTASGLVAYWTFDEGSGTTAADSSGGGNTMSLVNGIAWIVGKLGGAISANGTTQYATAPAINLSATQTVTLAFWTNRTYSATVESVMVEASTNYNGSTTGFGFFPDDTQCQGIQVAVNGNVGYSVNCYAQPSSGVWHHVVAIYDKTQAGTNQTALYIDGVLQTPTINLRTSKNTNNFGTNPLYLFARAGNQFQNAGKVDDFRIYNRALSAAEIQQIYQAGNVALVSIAVTPANVSIAKGATQQYTATGTYADGSTQNLTGLVTWASSNTAAATISATGLATGGGTGSTTISATSGSVSGSTGLTVTPPVLASISVTPTNASIPTGATQQYTATGNYSDGSTQNLTGTVTWSSTNTAAATISGGGLATGAGTGTTTIRATSGAVSGSTTLTVTATLVSVAVSPVNTSIAKGLTQQYTATGTYSDGSTLNITGSVVWTSTSTTVATISATGLATAAGTGGTTIMAVSGTITGMTGLTVTPAVLTSITVTPANASLVVGSTQQYTATGTYTDGTTQNLTGSATWNSTNTAAATISSTGLATGAGTGTTTISATSGSITGSTSLTVTVSGLLAYWKFDDGSGATAADSSGNGNTMTLVNGVSWVTGRIGGAVSANGTNQYGAEPSINLSGTQTVTVAFWANRTYSKTTESVLFEDTANYNGSTTGFGFFADDTQCQGIQVALNGNVGYSVNCFAQPSSGAWHFLVAIYDKTQAGTNQTKLYVDGVQQTPTINLRTSQNTNNFGTNPVYLFSRGGTDFFSAGAVDELRIYSRALSAGEIQQLYQAGSASLVSLAVTPANVSIVKGTTQQYTATGTYSDSSTQNLTGTVTWGSSNTAAATIAAGGLATGTGAGTTTISATSGSITGSTSLTVTPALVSITVTPANVSMAKGTTQQYVATGNYSDGSAQNLTSTVVWGSTNTAAATIASGGLASGVAAGTTTITATLGPVVGSTGLTITSASLSSIAVTPTAASIAKGLTQQYTATGTYSDGSTQNLTSAVTWSSTNTSVATITAGGLATAVATGTTTIMATSGSVTGMTGLTVTPAVLTRITVTPATASIVSGTTQQYTATGTFSDNSTQNLTGAVAWGSSSTLIATISASGLATGAGSGTTTISATSGAISGSATLTVTPALVSIAVTPMNVSIAKGTTQQYLATGTYSDGSTLNLTGSVIWSSMNASVATIAASGLAAGAGTGSTTIMAVSGTITGMTGLTVTPAVLSSLAVTPANITLVVGNTQQFTATGTYTDGSTQNLTASVTWNSTNPAAATINASGLATGVAAGSTIIQATSSSIGGSTALTVTVNGLMAYWKFDDGFGSTAADSSGNGNTLNLVNGMTWVPGKIGDAISANGTNQFATTPAVNLSNTQAVTVAMWVNRTYSTTVESVLLEATANYNGSTTGFGIFPDDTKCQGIQIDVLGNIGYSANCYTQPSSGVWHHMVAIFDKTQQGANQTALYIDGVLQTPSLNVYSSTNTNSFGNNPIYMFARGGTEFLNAGQVDEVRIYARALSQNEIQALYQSGNATLVSIAVTPANATVAKGATQQYAATGMYSDGSTQNLTNTLSWTSTNTSAATVNGMGLATGTGAGSTTIQAAAGSISGSVSLTVTSAALVSIAVTPANASVTKGSTQQYTATGTNSDGTTQNLTTAVTWSSTNTAVATITSTGLATAVTAGTSTIQATLGPIVGSTSITVPGTLQSISVTPVSPLIGKGATLQFTATGNYSTGATQDLTSSVTWTSTVTSVATVTSGGLASGVGTGNSKIQATLGSVSGNTTLTVTGPVLVSIAVTPSNKAVIIGATQQFTATGTFSDGSVQNVTSSVAWSSTITNAATVSSSGLATGVAIGSTSIQAVSGLVVGATNLTVSPSGLVAYWTFDDGSGTAATDSSGSGYTMNLVNGVTWVPGQINGAVSANGNNQHGTVPSINLSGTKTVTVSFWSNRTYSTTVESVLLEDSTNYNGSTTGFGFFPDDTQCQGIQVALRGDVGYSVNCFGQPSSNVWHHFVAIYDKTQPGTSETALYIDGVLQTPTFNNNTTQNSNNFGVNPLYVFARSGNQYANAGLMDDLRLYNRALTAAEILQIYQVGTGQLVSLAVTPTNVSLAIGLNQQFTATGTYSSAATQNLTNAVTWSSSNPTAAPISNTGVATAAATGSTTITATSGSISNSTNLTITPVALESIAVTPANPSIIAGATQQLTAMGTYSNGTTQNLTGSVVWASSNAAVATVNSAGLVTGQSLSVGQIAGFSAVTATMSGVKGTAILGVGNQTGNGFTGVFTHQNDSFRTGQNVNETALTPSVVSNTATFGKLFSLPVDAFVYAQPLYVPNVPVSGLGTHNVLYVATEGNSVYAFDADSNTGANANPLWHVSLMDAAHGATAGETTVSSTNDVGCNDLVPQIGITGTPVIDPSTNTIYVEVKSKLANGTFVHRLHALDITSGNERIGSPITIIASVPGVGDGGVTVAFNPLRQMNRPGLLLVNGVVYVAFTSHCDTQPYHGWVLAYDAATLQERGAFNVTPNAVQGGIWMGGAGLAGDDMGNVFVATGNGTFDTTPPVTDFGDSIVKLSLSTSQFSVVDYFTPYDQAGMAATDGDLASGGVLLLPNQTGPNPRLLVQSGKEGTIYVINRDQMTAGNQHYCSGCTGDTQITQELKGVVQGVFGSPAYWNGNLYYCGHSDNVKQYRVSAGQVSTSAVAVSTMQFAYPGASPAVSANGTTGGILWAVDSSQYGFPRAQPAAPAVLHAFDATNVATELYNSTAAANGRDTLGNAVKFVVPTIANGKVYVGTQTEVDVYGILP